VARRWTLRLVAVAALGVMLYWHREASLTASTFIFVCVAGFLLFILWMAGRQHDFSHLPVPEGRVVAVVPVFNEEPELLRACLDSLVNQTHPLDAIYVVDDGSPTPAPVYRHPRVHWKRVRNGGKRRAQAAGLISEADRADFIVTVDSDSVVAPDGVERLLRAFSDPRVYAATGLPVLRNRTHNLITRVTDMEMVYSCRVMRGARSAVGAVCPTSGAFSAYRAGVFYDNVQDYLTSGTYSDDRRLTHYALARGWVVSVDEAIVETHMPTTPRGVFRQRTRWFKGALKFLPWEVRHLRGAPLAFRLWNTSMFVLYPILIAHAMVITPLTGGSVDLSSLVYWLILLYLQTAVYITGRPGVPLVERVLSWALLTPALSLFQLLLIRTALYWATTQVRSDSWATRGSAVQQPA